MLRPQTSPRVLGHLRCETPGPALIVVGGLHGNEPTGVAAMRRVAAALTPEPAGFRGDLILLSGNVRALGQGVRFVDRDLNRGWSDARLAALRETATASLGASAHEDREQLELAGTLEQAFAAARGRVYLIDLHTTSAAGIPFVMCRDTAAAREFAAALPLTLVLGLLDALEGTLAGWLGERCEALAVEGGQNADPDSEAHLEAVIWLALAAAGLAEAHRIPGLQRHRERLTRTRGDLPRVLQVRERHSITSDDRFQMEPGFANIQRIARSELLARDRTGEIRAAETGFVLMPLYQAKGDDGFFLAREEAAGNT
jgi:succinylglutamate desuccinylase